MRQKDSLAVVTFVLSGVLQCKPQGILASRVVVHWHTANLPTSHIVCTLLALQPPALPARSCQMRERLKMSAACKFVPDSMSTSDVRARARPCYTLFSPLAPFSGTRSYSGRPRAKNADWQRLPEGLYISGTFEF